MGRLPAAAKVIVVEGREVVMDERVGVNQLERGEWHEQRLARSTASLGGGDGQDGPDSFASAQDCITHRGVDGRRTRVCG